MGPSGWTRPAARCLSHGAQITNSPYDLDLSRNAARGLPSYVVERNTPPDDPFGVAELERVLRVFDRDSSALPPGCLP